MPDSGVCLRPTSPASFVLKEKRSEFIASLFPVASQEEARSAYDAVRREHFSATHNCPAWRTGFPRTAEFCSDDGEPGGTAGRPILGVLQRRSLCNALIVVTRYFGGVKLGVRGLIDAYAQAAEGAAALAAVEESVLLSRVSLRCDYGHLAPLNRLIKGCGVLPARVTADYAEEINVSLLLTPACEKALSAALSTYEGRALLLDEPARGASELAAKLSGEV